MGGSEKTKTKAKVLRCPNCGASEATFDIDVGGLRCEKCRTVFASPKVNQLGGVDELVGEIRSAGAENIDNDFAMTFSCPSCGANVMVDKGTERVQCHWCRHDLKTAQKIPNGAMPDLVLPFKIRRKTALAKMHDFLKQRRFFSVSEFASDLAEDTIQGVYLPYMVVDVKAKVKLIGDGENEVKVRLIYQRDKNSDSGQIRKVHDVSVFGIERDFDLRIDDLTIEASRDKIERISTIDTTHIINAIMPFDTENAVAWDARYLKGYSSEKRDLDVGQLKYRLGRQVEDIARYAAMDTTSKYSRGVHWDKVEVETEGIKWKTAYFPVWLYSCPSRTLGGKKTIHYIAVNARTGETMGSVPLRPWAKTIIVSIPLVALLAYVVFLCAGGYRGEFWLNAFILLALVVILILTINITKSRSREYTNKSSRHMYELDTRIEVKNMRKVDEFRYSTYRERGGMVEGYNEDKMTGAHNLFLHNDELEDATGISASTYIKIGIYIVIGLFVLLAIGVFSLLIGSIVGLVS